MWGFNSAGLNTPMCTCSCPPPLKFPQVPYGDAPQLFSPEQVMAMLMTYLKKVAETALNKPVGDCVVSVSLHSSSSGAIITVYITSSPSPSPITRYHHTTLMPNAEPSWMLVLWPASLVFVS